VSAPASRAQRGFTLMELMVTLVISVFGLLGVLRIHATLSRTVSETDQTQEALSFGTRTLETLRAMRVDDMVASISTTDSAPPLAKDAYATSTGRTGTAYQADVEVTEVPGTAGLWRVRVEVSWTEGEDSHHLPIEVLRTTREAL
jgi:prepilin-type N-terminal cleavage/methylation domain-containing protein